MTAGIGKLKRQITDKVFSEIQTQIFSLTHAQMRDLVKNNLIFFRAVAFLKAKTADRFADCVLQRRFELLGTVQEPDVT